MDGLIMADGSTMTAGVREIGCRLNNDAASFDKAADNLRRAAQIVMSGETLRQLVEEEGRRVIVAQGQGELCPAFQASDCVIPEDPARRRIYVGVDGVMVPVVTDTEKQKRREKVVMKRRQRPTWKNRPKPLPPVRRGADQPFKEFKTITFYNENNSRRHILLSRCKRTRVSSLVRREAGRLKFAEADERIGNVDGASWIPPQLEGPELNLSALGLDFYHLGENVHRTKRATFGEDNPEGTKWSDDLMHTFKHRGYAEARESLLGWRTGLRARKRAAADRLLNYVVERRDMISYPEFVAKGWQIGSGPTEARCKTGTARIKRSGQRWDPAHAEQVAALTNIRDSGQWNLYWTNLIPLKT
jgi:hypothetical protein